MMSLSSMKRFFAAVAAAFLLPWPSQAETRVDRYAELCDASAAAPLDGEHFIVAEDEHDVLAIYRRGSPQPVAKVDLVDHLKNRKPSGKIKEGDIEGAARVGNRVYWITSHGRDKKGDPEPTRHRFFAIETGGAADAPKAAPIGVAYKDLLRDLVEHLQQIGRNDPPLTGPALDQASQRAPEAPDGLNIEGLTDMPDGRLLIGFRNPLPKGRAILVPLHNPSELVAKAAPGKDPVRARFGSPIALDLDGRGIRSIERVGTDYVIVAGPYGDPGPGPAGRFGLYLWGGPGASERPTPISADLVGLRPEAAFRIGDTRQIYLLSDDGDEKVGHLDCKSDELPLEKKSFRALLLTLP